MTDLLPEEEKHLEGKYQKRCTNPLGCRHLDIFHRSFEQHRDSDTQFCVIDGCGCKRVRTVTCAAPDMFYDENRKLVEA